MGLINPEVAFALKKPYEVSDPPSSQYQGLGPGKVRSHVLAPGTRPDETDQSRLGESCYHRYVIT